MPKKWAASCCVKSPRPFLESSTLRHAFNCVDIFISLEIRHCRIRAKIFFPSVAMPFIAPRCARGLGRNARRSGAITKAWTRRCPTPGYLIGVPSRLFLFLIALGLGPASDELGGARRLRESPG